MPLVSCGPLSLLTMNPELCTRSLVPSHWETRPYTMDGEHMNMDHVWLAAPVTIITVARKHMGERKIRLGSLFGNKNVRICSANIDCGVATAARIIVNSMAACAHETYCRKSWDFLISNERSFTNSYDSCRRMYIDDSTICHYSLFLWRCWSGRTQSDVYARGKKNDERYFGKRLNDHD